MNNLTVYHATSFPRVPTGGNAAGVILVEQELEDARMQEIAKTVSYSETAFVHKSEEGEWHIRYFTPAVEVPLCGHATIAAISILVQQGLIHAGTHQIHTKAGIKEVQIDEKGIIWLNQGIPIFLKEADNNSLLTCTDLEEDDLWKEFPAQVVSLGIPVLLLGIRSCGTLVSMDVDHDVVATLLNEHNADILYVLSSQTSYPENTVQARMFAPPLGIKEESATGMAAGCAGALIRKYTLKDVTCAVIEQGYSLGKPSEIMVQLASSANPEEILIGGTALIRKESIITI